MTKQAVPTSQQTPQFYVINFTLNANAQLTQTLILDNDSEFDLFAIEGVTDQDGTLTAATGPTQIPENFSIQIENQTTGRKFMNDLVRRGNICGKAFSNMTPEGARIRFPRKTQLNITVQNLVAVAIVVQICFKGYKVYNAVPGAA